MSKRSKLTPGLLRRLWTNRDFAESVIRLHWPLLAFALILSVVSTLLELLRPQPIRLLFDLKLLPDPEHLPGLVRDLQLDRYSEFAVVGGICLLVLLISAGLAVSNYLMQVKLAFVGNRIITSLRKITFQHLTSLPSLFHDDQKTGDLVLRLTGDIQMIRSLLVDFAVAVVGRMTLIAGLLATMLWMNPRLALITWLTLPGLVWTTGKATHQVRAITRGIRRKESELAHSAQELIGEMRLFAAYGRRDLEDDKFDRKNIKTSDNSSGASRIEARVAGQAEFTLAIGICIVMAVGAYDIHHDRMSAGELLVFLSYMRTLYKPIRSLVGLSSRTGKAAACVERVLEILEAPITLTDAPDAIEAPRFRGAVRLRDVTMTYGGKVHALRGVDLSIAPGEVVGVVGPSGAGKSSLCMLLPRLYDPDGGSVEIDGVDIRRFTLQSLRSQVCLVLQDAGVFDLTVEENVAFGLREWSREAVIDACKAAGLHETITEMPEGYATLTGERGARLSGGQKRRLAIARALIRDPRVLILDEPFQGLDPVTADSIAETIRANAHGRTTLIVTHQGRFLRGVPRIIRVNRGALAELNVETDETLRSMLLQV